jgi:hypothetical protein
VIRFDLLERLADHLEKGKLGHDRFCFGTWHDYVRNSMEWAGVPAGFCGTLGCAVGEAPFAHPEDWELKHTPQGDVVPLLRSDSSRLPMGDARLYYGLSSGQSSHLFVAHYQRPGLFGGKKLSAAATKEEVAANIRSFIQKMQEGQS